MLRVEAAGYPIVLHVHDEIVCEVPIGFGSTEEFTRLMIAQTCLGAGAADCSQRLDRAAVRANERRELCSCRLTTEPQIN